MQVGGAQCRLMVHNVALYHWSGAQRRSHKPKIRQKWCDGSNRTLRLQHVQGMKSIMLVTRCFLDPHFQTWNFQFSTWNQAIVILLFETWSWTQVYWNLWKSPMAGHRRHRVFTSEMLYKGYLLPYFVTTARDATTFTPVALLITFSISCRFTLCPLTLIWASHLPIANNWFMYMMYRFTVLQIPIAR